LKAEVGQHERYYRTYVDIGGFRLWGEIRHTQIAMAEADAAKMNEALAENAKAVADMAIDVFKEHRG